LARLIPKIKVDDIALKPERDVARALVEQLPSDCIVYHSYPWLKADRYDHKSKSTLKEGETDFVVIVPSHGMLILEVKGGTIEYEPADMTWYRRIGSNRKEITDPFKQAQKATHFLKDKICKHAFRNAEKLPFPFGYAVVFPDCKYNGPAPPGALPVIILTTDDLQYFKKRIPNVLHEWSQMAQPAPMDKGTLDAVQKAISPSFQLLPVLFRQVEEQEEKLFRLTQEQIRLLDFLTNHDRAAIKGVAGSGKTLLARAQAQRFADAGMHTLLVCFNKALAEWIRDTLPEEYANRITVQHFHGLCSEWCQRAGLDFTPTKTDQEKFWREVAAESLIDAIEKLPDRFDAVVVDEGQDFFTDWWVPLEHINAKGDQGMMYVFYDPAQNLFVKEDFSLPDLDRPFSLPTNCRNTRRIAAKCGQIIGQEVPTRPDAPEGVETRVIEAPSEGDQNRAIEATLDEWIKKSGLKLLQVAILSPSRLKNSSLGGQKRAKIPITQNLSDWRGGKGILFSTIRAFKGLEADAVLMVDIPKPDGSHGFSQADFYVACSRAKHLLVILSK